MILLDSDIMIDFLRKYSPAISWLSSLGDEEIALPGYVAMELMQGCKNKLELQEIRKFIANVEVIWPTPETCDQTLETFADYNLSHNLGLIDALIGQTSISLGLPLHTFNVKHYAVLPGLITIQPYKR
ncbi:type II toxin-antitoxin system VapC family toxin [Cronbergia sp. UHCC 0137]|uniref:type II toxin-antitoxin system VapC family toxin n=1 Tax=Cronbergia sp. UHCC 0137 TaxID=3110239 RepID=UPI002B20B5DB|nr:type II toxin-antitoxin system VapC family toxin [Cronbergia sp. UHCC 0137]MEA5618764.1 type II toxin-antitoxin system VapC family toxin [Cronbergia sp. UHCC 0137]